MHLNRREGGKHDTLKPCTNSSSLDRAPQLREKVVLILSGASARPICPPPLLYELSGARKPPQGAPPLLWIPDARPTHARPSRTRAGPDAQTHRPGRATSSPPRGARPADARPCPAMRPEAGKFDRRATRTECLVGPTATSSADLSAPLERCRGRHRAPWCVYYKLDDPSTLARHHCLASHRVARTPAPRTCLINRRLPLPRPGIHDRSSNWRSGAQKGSEVILERWWGARWEGFGGAGVVVVG